MCLPKNYARKIIETFILNQQPTPVLIMCRKYLCLSGPRPAAISWAARKLLPVPDTNHISNFWLQPLSHRTPQHRCNSPDMMTMIIIMILTTVMMMVINGYDDDEEEDEDN